MSQKNAIDLAMQGLDLNPAIVEYLNLLNAAIDGTENLQSQRILSELDRLVAVYAEEAAE